MQEEIAAGPEEADTLAALSDALSRGSSAWIDTGGRRYPISPSLRQALSVACEALARGQTVAVVPSSRDVSTDEAAAFLGVPAGRVLHLLERGELLAHGERRILLSDLVRFKAAHDSARLAASRNRALTTSRLSPSAA